VSDKHSAHVLGALNKYSNKRTRHEICWLFTHCFSQDQLAKRAN